MTPRRRGLMVMDRSLGESCKAKFGEATTKQSENVRRDAGSVLVSCVEEIGGLLGPVSDRAAKCHKKRGHRSARRRVRS